MKTNTTDEFKAEMVESHWNWLYKVSGAAALITGVLFLIAGINLIAAGLEPSTINGWSSLFGNNWLLLLFSLHAGISGVQPDQLYVLNPFDVVIMVLVATTFLGLYTALRRTSKIWSFIALVQPFLGIVILIATNAAGRSAVMGAVLVISFVMLRSTTFGNATPYAGILASVLLLAGDISVGIARSSIMAVLIAVGYVLLIAWFFLIARRLLQLRHPEKRRSPSIVQEGEEMRNATKVTVSALGALMGVAGIEHGIGEILQGNIAPDGMMILSWPDSALFRTLGGEPAMTIVPNLLITGILAIFVSLIFLTWATLFVQRKNGGLVLILLSIVMLLVGGGIFPPLLGIIIGAAGTRINAPLTWWRAHLSVGFRRFLEKLWLWSFIADLIAWLLLFPGSILLGYFFGVSNMDLIILIVIPSAFGFLFLSIIAGFAYDIQRRIDLLQTPPMRGQLAPTRWAA